MQAQAALCKRGLGLLFVLPFGRVVDTGLLVPADLTGGSYSPQENAG